MCQNYLWKFLGALEICKSNIMQRKLEQVKLSLQVAAEVAKKLNSQRINYFMDTCINMNQICINIKQSLSDELIFSKREKTRIAPTLLDVNGPESASDSMDEDWILVRNVDVAG